MVESADKADGVEARVSVVQLGPDYFATPDPYWTPALLVGLGSLLVGVWWFATYGFPGKTQLLVGLGIVVLTSQFSLWQFRRRARDRIRTIFSERWEGPIELLIAAIREDWRTWGARGEFGTIQREMMRRGRPPEVVVLQGFGCKWAPRGEVIEIEFEPRRLDELDEGFRALQAATNEDDPVSDAGSGVAVGLGIVVWIRRLGRQVFGSERTLPTLLFFGINFSVLRGLFNPANYIQLAFSVSFALFIVWMILSVGSRQFFVAPAGLLSRRCRLFSRRWTRHLFAANAAALWLIDSGENETISVIAADTDECVQFSLTRAEAELLVRAWMSPLAPPVLEQLSDLA